MRKIEKKSEKRRRKKSNRKHNVSDENRSIREEELS